ncbi:outer membrane lipoprotein LolB [Catenovulum agarivorans DS-2]|uniref:Outer-membrane lipoprotein LolB n=1 Tax=Catenovulum agarivorans DS-2 TaxID=1328313 RepID=W7QWV5_9ALTE|nr:lipoprotein insertase outer membrane protein LolB [Catenovulum agarivorans]EWH12228.1 outer membrane lipoprotein LolB [Catenovulum agarivorans DS-2]
MKAFNYSIRGYLLSLVVFLSGCALKPDLPQLKDIYSAKQIKSFTAEGKIAFIRGKDRESVNFFWQQQSDNYQISLNTFLGIQVADITGFTPPKRVASKQKPAHISIKADGKSYQSNAPEQLLEQVIGWPIPINKVANWAKGDHQGVVMNRHDNGLAKEVFVRTQFDQEWRLQYLSYHSLGNVQLPKKIKCQYLDFTLIMQINEWKEINQ